MLREMVVPKGLKWWDCVISLPPVLAFYLGIYLATYFVALNNPVLEAKILKYAGVVCGIIAVTWVGSFTRRFGWKARLPLKFCLFWVMVMALETLVWKVAVMIFEYLNIGNHQTFGLNL